MRYEFTVPGPAIGKAKKFNRKTGRGYNPDNVDAFMNLVSMAARDVLPPRILGPVKAEIDAYFEWPQSSWRMRNPRGQDPMTEKPDADNISKGVLDGLRSHFNDQQVYDLRVTKWRVPQGNPARTVVTIEPMRG